ncbi:MAG: 2-amino-4-hydroxy-6-hydroxymethyldihydropteridine diphosphokinase [Desulfobacteraceae bacterium]|nr:2-amino-4-hydroxy-6-hydroxymethyldihydropteridine diphosphokinase [Desulfobacteraceae bacterium]
MALAFIGLGSNLGPGPKNLLAAWRKLKDMAGVTPLALSPAYRSAPLGMESDAWFTNAVGVCETSLPPRGLLSVLLKIEADMGRDRAAGRDRVIDLDLLYYDQQIIKEPGLVVPHPEIAQRLFVLAPLCDLAPDHPHPATGRSSLEMRQRVAGQAVELIAWGKPS